MSLQDITITASINSIVTQSYGQRTYIASTDEQSFPIEEITGSQAGVWPNFVPDTNYTTDLVVNVTQSWSGSTPSIVGNVTFIHNIMDEFINGEFSGSNPYVISDGNLTDDYCGAFLTANTSSFKYSIFPFASQYQSPYDDNHTAPRDGEILLYFIDNPAPTASFQSAKMSYIDKDGNNLAFTLQQLTTGDQIQWINPGVGLVELTIAYRRDDPNYAYFTFQPNYVIFPPPTVLIKDYLDYTFEATSSATGITSSINGAAYYFTYGAGAWNVTTDGTNGWNPTSEQYFFPLTPNTDIYFTASIDLTLNQPATFSWAIQQWDTTTTPNLMAGNAPATVGIGDIANPDYFYSPSNPTYQYLARGNHVLTITSSVFQPLQGFATEIDAYIESQHFLDNEYLIGSGSTDNNSLLPFPFKSWKNGTAIGVGGQYSNDSVPEAWISAENYYANNSGFQYAGYSGGVVLKPGISPTENTLLTYYDPNGNINLWGPSSIGQPFKITVEIPDNPFPNVYDWGPPSQDINVVTTNQGNFSSVTIQNIIGTIPSGSTGAFEFIYTIQVADKKLGIEAPSGSSIDTPQLNFAIGRIAVEPLTTASINSFTWNFTQSNPPFSSTSSFIFEPYFPSAFYNTDCDVLMNNYSENDFSGLVQSVNYENGGTIPSNLQQIISGTAEYAEVNDYLYRAHANTLPRYEGVRTTSPGFNLNSIDGYGTLPNVEQTTTYFAYFTSLKSNSPLYKGTTSPVLKYIIREDGETFNPATDEITYYDVIDSFPARAYANLLYDDTTTFSSTQPILLSGYSYTPIMYNINTSNELTATYTTTMSFNNLQGITSSIGTPASYSLYVQNSPRTRTLTANTPVNPFDGVTPPFGPFIDKPSLSWFNGGFQFNGTPTNYARSLFQIDYFLVNNTNTTQTGIFRSSLYKINGATTTLLAQYDSPVVISSTLLGGVFYTYNPNYDFIHDFIPNSSDYVYIEVELIADPGVTGAIRNWSWKIETLGIPIGSVFSPFWTTGSNNSLSITASKDLSDTLLGNYKQKDIITSGFPSIKFSNDIKIGDEFRFEYDENYVHKVTDIQTSGSQFVYILDRPIPNLSSLNINHFTVRRKIKDYITGLSLGSTLYNPVSEGFLLPEYPSVTIKNDFSAIIKDLAEKGLL
jgi:hypothetical protein